MKKKKIKRMIVFGCILLAGICIIMWMWKGFQFLYDCGMLLLMLVCVNLLIDIEKKK